MNPLFLTAALALFAAPGPEAPGGNKQLLLDLSDHDKSGAALEALVKQGKNAIPDLTGIAVEGNDLAARGWAIVGLARIGGPGPAKTLETLSGDPKQPPLVRAWASAGRIRLAADFDSLIALAPLVAQQPSLQRPFSLKVRELATSGKASAEKLIAVTAANYQLQQEMVEPILALGLDSLVAAMAHAKDGNVRQMAAAYLGTLAQRQGKAGNETVGLAVARAYAFDAKATDVPWAGGPLYVPNIGWDKQMGTKLVEALIAWYLWAERTGHPDNKSKISHNLNSISLAGVVGYSPDWQDTGPEAWLKVWRNVAGKDGLKKLLAAQGADKEPRWAKLAE